MLAPVPPFVDPAPPLMIAPAPPVLKPYGSPAPPLTCSPSVPFVNEFWGALNPTADNPATEAELETEFRIASVGVVVPTPTLPVKSAMKMAVGALLAPMANPVA